MIKKLHASVSTLLILSLGIILAIAIIKGRPTIETNIIESKRPPVVDIIIAKPSIDTISVFSQASIESKQRIQLNARVSGTIETVSEKFIVGAILNKKDLLVSLDDIEYRNAVSQAKLTLAQAKQQVATEHAQAREAKSHWRDLGDKSANDFFLRKPQLATAKAQLLAAETGLEVAKANLGYTRIKAPFAGRIASINANLGQFVNVGTTIAELYSTDKLQLQVPLTKQQLKLLAVDNYQANPNININITDKQRDDNHQWQGKFISVDGNVDVNTRLYNAVVEVDNQSAPYLVPGIFVDVELQSSSMYSQIELPIKALVDGQYVYVVIEGQLYKKPIQILATIDQSVLVGGIEKGEQVVVSRPLWTVEGSAVALRVNSD